MSNQEMKKILSYTKGIITSAPEGFFESDKRMELVDGVSRIDMKGIFGSTPDMSNFLARVAFEQKINLKSAYEFGSFANWRVLAMMLVKHWMEFQSVFRFEPDFAEMLMKTPIDNMNKEVLKRLPEQSTFISADFEMAGKKAIGFFVSRVDYSDEIQTLNVLIVHENLLETGFTLPLDGDNISDMIDSLLDNEEAKKSREDFLKIMNLVLYLCSKNMEVAGEYELKSKTHRRLVARNKKVKTMVKTVGYRVGSEITPSPARYLAKMSTGTPKQTKVVHVRRAHWHSFWTGPMKGTRELIVKWVAPAIIGAKSISTPTVRGVK